MLAKRITDSSNFKEHHEFILSKSREATGEPTCQKACFFNLLKYGLQNARV